MFSPKGDGDPHTGDRECLCQEMAATLKKCPLTGDSEPLEPAPLHADGEPGPHHHPAAAL